MLNRARLRPPPRERTTSPERRSPGFDLSPGTLPGGRHAACSRRREGAEGYLVVSAA